MRKVLLPVAAAGLITLTAPGVGQGATPGPELQAAATVAVTAADSGAGSAAASQAYWTPQRMRKATPLDLLPSGAALTATSPAPAVAGRPASVPPQPAERTAGGPARPSPQTVFASSAAGRVFFHNPRNGADYSCSASALNSPSRQLVVTAGHCVHGGRGGTWMTKWVYVPDYHNGTAPYGVFAAKSFRAFQAWITSSSLARDVAMVTTWPNNGRKLVNVTGGNGLSWNASRTTPVAVLGYPSNYYQAQVQMYCTGWTGPERGTTRVQIHCRYGQGASGGPWLRSYNTSSRLGYVDGVTSTVTLSTGWDQSPYFDTAVAALYKAQGSLT
ncbi:trypsin-like serine peptidase [Streptacidiphilus rugosus]|uniref:trypsin-like serine peptidase n=1 Tax=Streptacidiphilus rugosus TaxID=405783 RepID=UPI001E2BBAC3|nr:trypsin-like peptidase domain-containing protein [Streptacidiphilus rugosus]